MRLSNLFYSLFTFLIPPAIVFTLLLYAYAPLLDCSFPQAKSAVAGCSIPGQQRDAIPAEVAPFRLLAFGDPQLEGDTSLPTGTHFASVRELGHRLGHGDLLGFVTGLGPELKLLITRDVPWLFYDFRKRIDLWGNDLYLAHIYRSVSWWSDPTHVVVLGDLLGSQWIGDDEHKRRSDRFWKKVFKGTEKVPSSITGSSGRVEVLGEDPRWKKRIIAVAGNHDIGYAGDIDQARIDRFEETYGHVNWDIRFKLNSTSETSSFGGFGSSLFGGGPPELHVVVLNTMNLDSPAKDGELQQQSRDFAEAQLVRSSDASNSKSATVLLTHIPLFKNPGVCIDSEFFDWFPDSGGIKEQNHLHQQSSAFLLNGLADENRRGKAIILNGHDHEGCDTLHYRKPGEGVRWEAAEYRWADDQRTDDSLLRLREITVRSMMGSFGGYTGFLSGWFDHEEGEWKFEYNTCPLGVQHIWWGVHVLDLVVVGLGLAWVGFAIAEELADDRRAAELKRQKLKAT